MRTLFETGGKVKPVRTVRMAEDAGVSRFRIAVAVRRRVDDFSVEREREGLFGISTASHSSKQGKGKFKIKTRIKEYIENTCARNESSSCVADLLSPFDLHRHGNGSIFIDKYKYKYIVCVSILYLQTVCVYLYFHRVKKKIMTKCQIESAAAVPRRDEIIQFWR